MVTIGLGSTSALKQAATGLAIEKFAQQAQVVAVKADSGVSEQPFDSETIAGAQNRAAHAAQLVPHADFTLAIESGIFSLAGRYYDKAIVVARLKSGEFIQAESDAVEFPQDAVLETIRRGVDVWTCGKILAEWARVKQHDDPHFSLVGKPRAEFVNEAVVRVFQELRIRGVL